MAIPGSATIIAAIFGTVAADTQLQLSERPISLITEAVDDGVAIRLLGKSQSDVSLRYRLEITGDAGSGNRTNQGGSVTLAGGAEPRTLATIRMTGSNPRGRLVVEIDGGEGYEELIATPK